MFTRPQDFVRDFASVEILVPILGTHGGARLRPLDYFDESRKHKGGTRKDPPPDQGPALPPPAAFVRRREQERVAATRNETIPAEATEGRRPLKSEKGREIGEPDAGLVKQSGGKCNWCLGEGEEEAAMIACGKCSKDFHVECIKGQWAKYRDHFEWAEFVCPYCRLVLRFCCQWARFVRCGCCLVAFNSKGSQKVVALVVYTVFQRRFLKCSLDGASNGERR